MDEGLYDAPAVANRRVTPPSRLPRPRPAEAVACRLARCLRRGAAVHAAHAQIGPAVYSSDVELWTARLGFGRERLSVSAAPSRNGPALAADAANVARHMA